MDKKYIYNDSSCEEKYTLHLDDYQSSTMDACTRQKNNTPKETMVSMMVTEDEMHLVTEFRKKGAFAVVARMPGAESYSYDRFKFADNVNACREFIKSASNLADCNMFARSDVWNGNEVEVVDNIYQCDKLKLYTTNE